MKHLKSFDHLNESATAEAEAHSILSNKLLQRKLSEVLSDAHAFIRSTQSNINNYEFASAMKEVVGKIINNWEF